MVRPRTIAHDGGTKLRPRTLDGKWKGRPRLLAGPSAIRKALLAASAALVALNTYANLPRLMSGARGVHRIHHATNCPPLPSNDFTATRHSSQGDNIRASNGTVVASSCNDVLITSPGGVGSSTFMYTLYDIAKKNSTVFYMNSPDDYDQFKHTAATFWKQHDASSIRFKFGYAMKDAALRQKVKAEREEHGVRDSYCFHKVLVIIGDPIHTIESVYRRFEMDHIRKLQVAGGMRRYGSERTLRQIFEDIARSGRDETGVARFVTSWHEASIDRENWPEVRLATTRTLYDNAAGYARWIGVTREDDLRTFSDLRYDVSRRKHNNVKGVVDDATMRNVSRAFETVTKIINGVEMEAQCNVVL